MSYLIHIQNQTWSKIMIDKNELKVEFEDKIDSIEEQLSNCIRDIYFILDVELFELKLIVNKME